MTDKNGKKNRLDPFFKITNLFKRNQRLTFKVIGSPPNTKYLFVLYKSGEMTEWPKVAHC